MKSPTTITTAYSGIGRGDWTVNKGFCEKLARSADAYFSYFERLAALENKMIILTSPDLKPRVEVTCNGKPTTVIVIDIKKKFRYIRGHIEKIQKDGSFTNRLEPRQLKNPEYWSSEYVLVCNSKTHLVNKVINMGLVKTPLVAWVDFGYCHKSDATRGLEIWDFSLDESKMHLPTIKRGLTVTPQQQVFDFMIGNHVYIIGGAIVGLQHKWKEFYRLVLESQKIILDNNIVDDDQGTFVMYYHKCPNLFNLNYLGRGKWFDLSRCFRSNTLGAKTRALRIFLSRK